MANTTVTVVGTPNVITVQTGQTPKDIVVTPAGTQSAIAVTTGPLGPSDKNFVFTQVSASSIWTITHNMGKMPAVEVIDSGNNVVYGDVNYVSTNVVQITFNAAFGGKAILN